MFEVVFGVVATILERDLEETQGSSTNLAQIVKGLVPCAQFLQDF